LFVLKKTTYVNCFSQKLNELAENKKRHPST
jgi:hypothetical protein